jgi:type IV pilus assembly protein PilE
MNKTSGFTLVELMIVVAIIGIIAAIALPSYQGQVERSRRADCQSSMTAAANAIERYKTGAGQGSYLGAALGAAGVYPASCPVEGNANFYAMTIEDQTANTFTLLATPQGLMAGTGRMTLTHTGRKCWFDDADDADVDVGVCTPF